MSRIERALELYREAKILAPRLCADERIVVRITIWRVDSPDSIDPAWGLIHYKPLTIPLLGPSVVRTQPPLGQGMPRVDCDPLNYMASLRCRMTIRLYGSEIEHHYVSGRPTDEQRRENTFLVGGWRVKLCSLAEAELAYDTVGQAEPFDRSAFVQMMLAEAAIKNLPLAIQLLSKE